ncbi:MAG: glycosyltransferase [Methylovulum sp.]|nr:glycosyltransferase [Methylovulum sp.]
MKILHVYRTYFPDTQGGLEEVIRQICRNTLAYGVESRVFTLSSQAGHSVVVREEASVYRYHKTLEMASCGVSFSALAGFRQLVAWADIVHYHFPWPFADVLHLLAAVKKPSVLTYHSDIVRQKSLSALYRPLMRHFLGQVNCIVATSPNYAASSDVLQDFKDKVEIIPIGLDNASYPVASKDILDSVQARCGQGFFLFIGVLRYYKGLHILFDAIQQTNLRVVVAGLGPIENELREQARQLGLNNVQFLGYVSDQEKVALIRLAKAIVFPSHLRSEAFGVTLVEGAMLGKPLISTEIGTGTSYVNINNETGVVIPPSNTRQLQQAMKLLDEDNTLAKRLGEGARLRYERLLTGEKMGQSYAQLYRRLLDSVVD